MSIFPEVNVIRFPHYPIPRLPEVGFIRLPQIVGDKKANPPIPAIYPISKAQLWKLVKEGKFPKPVKLAPRITAWRVEDIRAFIEKNNR